MRKLFIKSVYSLCACYMSILMQFGLMACSNDEFSDYNDDDGGIKSFTSFTATIGDEANTRAYLTDSSAEGKKQVLWTANDRIIVFSDIKQNFVNQQFIATNVTEENVATFDKYSNSVSGNKFFAYYPATTNLKIDQDNPNILHTSLNANTIIEGERISIPMLAISNDNSLRFKQVAGLIHISISDIYRLESIKLTGNRNESLYGKGTIDLTEEEPVFKLDDNQQSGQFFSYIISDEERQLLGNGIKDFYFNLPPMTFEDGFKVDITGYDENGNKITYQKVSSPNQKIERAKINHYPVIRVNEERGIDESNFIKFADDNVKAICIENWDTNGDGELSYKEAAEVSDISNKFCAKSEIKSFEEFQYFTEVTSIGNEAFYGCSSLTSIVIPEGVSSIGYSAFNGCSNLTSIALPGGVTFIGTFAFNGCSSLASIVIPEGVTSIGYSVFRGCSSLASIEIPKGVTSIDDFAFEGCSSLTSLEIPEGVTSICDYAFCGCSSLKTIVIPNGVTSIGNWAFQDCSSLTSIEIPEGVISIGMGAFFDCKSLTSIVIPTSVTTIGDSAFCYCSSLTNIVIPEGVTSIGERFFNDCGNLTSIVIPESVTSIGKDAFCYCSNLKSLTCLAVNPPALGDYAFWGMSGIIYVPAVSVDAYKAADDWKDYASQIQAIPE